MPKPRVHVVPDTADLARPNACAALRLLDPYASSAVADVADVTYGLAPEPSDTLVLQRLARGVDAAALVRANGPRLIYDLDDNLLDPHPDPATEAELAPHRPQIRTLLRFADQVTVSTPALAARVAGLNPRVRVLSNALDDQRFPEPRPRAPNGRLHIGYYGTFTHLADLMRVAGPTRAALAQLPSPPRLTFCGVSTDPRLPALFAGLATVDLLPATADYPSFIEQMRQQPWDFALAPLADSPFTAAKVRHQVPGTGRVRHPRPLRRPLGLRRGAGRRHRPGRRARPMD